MDLILKSVYNSVNAPTHRGFSYIEIWMVGVEIPILIGIVNHGFLLAMKKYYQSKAWIFLCLFKTAAGIIVISM